MGQLGPDMCSALLLAAILSLAQSAMAPAAAARAPASVTSRQQDRERHILHPQQHRLLSQQKPPFQRKFAAFAPDSAVVNVTNMVPPSTAINGAYSTRASSPAPSKPNSNATTTAGPKSLQSQPAGPIDGLQGPDGSINGVAWDPTDTENRNNHFLAADSSVTDGPSKGCQFIRGVAFGAPDAKDQQGNILAPGFQWDPAANPLMQNMTTLLQAVTMGSSWQLQATDNAAQCCNLCLAHTDTNPQNAGVQVAGKPCNVFSWVPAAAWGTDTAAANNPGNLSAVAAGSKASAAAVVASGACLLITLGPINAAVAMVWGIDSSAQSGVPYLS